MLRTKFIQTIRTELTTVGQAGADVGMPAQAPTIATALRAMGYATGQFGKNHLGDLNKYLPCLHGVEDNTTQPRWGKIGKQKINDEGPLPPKRMKLDWFPTFVSIAGNPTIANELLKGKQLGDTTYKVHLDGYDQTNLITGKGPSNRHEVIYFTESTLGAVRIDDYKYIFIAQPNGWFGGTVKLDWPSIINLRLDPFERTPTSMGYGMDFYSHEFWRFVFVQDEIEKLGKTFVEYPPMQPGASFNLEAVKEQVIKAINSQQKAS